MGLCLALTLSAPATVARGQAAAPISFDPDIARQGTTLVLGVDGTALSSNGESPTSITVAMPRGTQVDTAAREQLCSRAQTARGTCPAASRIGFGRYVVNVAGFLVPGGQTQLTWSIDAYLGEQARVVLSAKLLGADSVATLLAPDLGTTVPSTTTTTARLVRRTSGPELRIPGLPVDLQVAPPTTVIPARLELNLSAVRRTRQNFIRRYRIRTLSGYVVRKIRDHRLIGHDLLRTPRTCRSSWPYELRVGFPSGVQRSAGRLACTKSLL